MLSTTLYGSPKQSPTSDDLFAISISVSSKSAVSSSVNAVNEIIKQKHHLLTPEAYSSIAVILTHYSLTEDSNIMYNISMKGMQ